VAIAASLAALIFALCCYRHFTFRSSTLDLGVYDQAVWKLAHFRAPELTTIGWNAFADHLSLVLFAFVPLYWLASTPVWLIASQALALALGYLALDPLLRVLEVPAGWKPVLKVCYLASPLLWNAAIYDFHPTTLAVPFLLVGLRAALTNERRTLILCGLVLLCLRDDLGLAVSPMALVGFTSLDREGRKTRIAVFLGGIAWMGAAGALASALGSDRHWAYHYGYIAASPSSAVLHPLHTLIQLLTGLARWDNASLIVLGLLAPLGFLSVLSPRRLALAPIPALPLLTSAGPFFHSVRFHYGAYLFPFLLVAAGTGASRRAPQALTILKTPALAIGCALAILLAAGPVQQLTAPVAAKADYEHAIALVRPSDHVMATSDVGPHLSQRTTLLMFPFALAPAVPDFPLPSKARLTTPETAASVDVVVMGPMLYLEEKPAFDAFYQSPYLRDFPYVSHFGEVTVYRRIPA
jgi:uncharacterized membrane protein